uniref:Uncharacterized protein n=1 Tax=Arion vulgaris TaxID=1028688 RepID=A0A0B6Z8M4_9EUPU
MVTRIDWNQHLFTHWCSVPFSLLDVPASEYFHTTSLDDFVLSQQVTNSFQVKSIW